MPADVTLAAMDKQGGRPCRPLAPALRLRYYPRRNINSLENISMRKITLLTLALSALLVSACNTVAGVGRDVQAAGKVVTGAAKDARK